MLMAIVLGLTGSFGSGKSTVASIFRELGVPVLDADQVAREVVEPGTEALKEVVREFGAGVLDENGSLDRKKVAEIVFDDPERLKRLNAIVHPRVGEGIARFLQVHAGDPLVVLEIPLLLETGRKGAMDKVIVVTTDEEHRNERLRADGFTESEIQARLASQMSQDRKVALADHVIDNSGDMESTRRQVHELARQCGLKTEYSH